MSSAMDTSSNGAASSASAAAAAAASAAAPAPPSTLRPDGRAASELRPLQAEHGLLRRADGSVSWSQGGCSVLAAVVGPLITGPAKDEKIDRATVQVNFKAASGMANNIDIERGSYIRQCFEPLILLSAHPRCKIQLHVQVLRDGGSVLACALNACSMALLDAGVSCSALLGAVCIALRERDRAGTGGKQQGALALADHDLLLDPVDEEQATYPCITLAYASTSPGTILSVVEGGAVDAHAFFEAAQMGRAAAAHVQAFMKLSMERKNDAVPNEITQ